MSDSAALRLALPPPLALYPEQPDRTVGKFEEFMQAVLARVAAPLRRRQARRLQRIVEPVNALAGALAAKPTDQLLCDMRLAGLALRRTEFDDEAAIASALAVVRELAHRTVGQRPFDCQIIGAFALLRGTVAEMATGEGKTLAASLAAAAAASAGEPVHVVTVNDYLARRDAEAMGPLYRAMGLSVGVVVSGQGFAERHGAYACDITYCTNKELAFDYLRDRMVLGHRSGNLHLKLGGLDAADMPADKLRLRGLHFAIVDEADSVLVDEARTPLIISGDVQSGLEEAHIALALDVARELHEHRDFTIVRNERRIVLTGHGSGLVEQRLKSEDGPWRSGVIREELIRQALLAVHLFKRDEDYLIRDDKIQVIDEFTGRVMEDRSWSEGLHQMIECKEGCAITQPRSTLARMTYQRFFRRYRRLAGMTGTASPAAGELWSIYRLAVAPIRTNRPVMRKTLPDRVFAAEAAKRRALLARLAQLNARGCPVLIGTRSVAGSQTVSEWLDAAGLAHVVLNAAQDAEEATIVAQAGERGRITVVTNMAGRGTDIKLGEGVAELGGLHVIMTERHEARRIDDQLAGRSGRQGEPGCCEAILSLDDPLLSSDGSAGLRLLGRSAFAFFGQPAGRGVLWLAQRRAERLHARMRRDLFRSDKTMSRTLGFSGRPE